MAKKLVFDRALFTAVVLLVGFGLVMVYSASAAPARDKGLPWNPFLVKQALAAGFGTVSMAVAMHVDYRQLRRPSVVYGGLAAILALLVLVLFSPEINGTRRWFLVGPISVQPSEIAKIVLLVFLADQIERKIGLVNRAHLLVPCALVTGLVAGLILLQPDMGTAVLLMATAFLLVFLAGLSWRYVAGAAVTLAPTLWFLVMTVPYRRQRIFAFLDPEADRLGAGWQAHQSLIAVGSGGLFGRGPGESLQKLYYLPHPQSDFIYSIVAEELGTLGALLVVVLFAFLLWRGVRVGLRAPDLFGRYLAWGVTGLLVIQALLNVSVALALLPTKGIPLPFISYGGSSLVVAMTLAGILLNVSQHA